MLRIKKQTLLIPQELLDFDKSKKGIPKSEFVSKQEALKAFISGFSPKFKKKFKSFKVVRKWMNQFLKVKSFLWFKNYKKNITDTGGMNDDGRK